MEIVINAAPVVVTPSPLPAGTEGVSYSVQLSASGGAGAPYTFAASGLPAGLTCTVDGLVGGTPTVAGTFEFELDVTDKSGTVTKL
jgi:hypothetical protein